METVRPTLGWSQFSLKTLMLGVAAVATIITLASYFIHAPFLSRRPALVITVGMIAFGIFLPSLWVGALRRLNLNGLLAHIAGVCGLVLLMISTAGKPSHFIGFVSACFALLAFVPSIAWYVVARAEPGEFRDGIRRWTIRYTKNALQLACGLFFFVLCFAAFRVVFK